MDEIETRPPRLTDEQKMTYAGIWLLKKMDLQPEDGGMVLSIHLPSDLTPLDDVIQELHASGHVQLNKKKQRWEISKEGYAHLGRLIDEAEALIAELDELERDEVIIELRRRGLDVFRARFLWEWYTGELDDLALFQQRRGITPVETLWAYYLVSDDFYATLALDVA